MHSKFKYLGPYDLLFNIILSSADKKFFTMSSHVYFALRCLIQNSLEIVCLILATAAFSLAYPQSGFSLQSLVVVVILYILFYLLEGIRRGVNHCPSLGSGMSIILPQLMGSLLFLTKLEMRRKQVVALVQQKHRRETMWVVYNQMKPTNIQQKVENGFAAVECRC